MDAATLDDAASEPDLPTGASIGRYVVQDVLGRGGMGIVYRAHDPDLGRDVAIKLLRVTGGSSSDASTRRVRMLREAQALAKLSHPNIVAVHDVGTFRDGVFLAMEFVPGRTLGQWIHDDNPSLSATLRVLVEAGRGLAAAHATGLVHRDVKPDNIFVGNDGRARVGDFGLARSIDATVEEPPPGTPVALPETRLRRDSLSSSAGAAFLNYQVTIAGSVLGTPQYMSAEQFRGELADASTDQFSFCVTAFEALYGVRPFPGLTMGELSMRVTAGDAPTLPRRPRVPVPRRVLKVLLRGLRAQTSLRYPELSALLDDLERDPMPAVRRGLSALVLAGAAALTVSYLQTRSADAPCGGAAARFAGVWSDAARAKLKSAFVATGRPYALDTFARVDAALDGFGERWRSARTQACEATRVHHEQSDAVLDLRMACLEHELDRASAYIAVFSEQVDGVALDRALQRVPDPQWVGRCDHVSALLAEGTSSRTTAQRARLSDLRRELSRGHALLAAGRFAHATTLLESLAQRAGAAGDARLEAEAQWLWGNSLGEAGEDRAAEAPLRRALRSAARAHDVQAEARIAVDLLHNVGYAQARHREGLATLPFVEAMVLGANDIPLDAKLASSVGLIQWAQGEYTEARAHCERAVSLAREHRIDPADRAHHLNNLGLVVNDAGDPSAALEVYGRALTLMAQTFGADHPNVAMVLNNRGNALNDLARYEEARADFERSLQLWQAALGPEHGDLSYPLTNLGAILSRLGQDEQAARHLERALVLDERNLGPNHVDLAFTLTSLGDAYYGLARHAEARPLLERALAIRRANDVPALRRAETLFFLAKTVSAQGEVALARRYVTEMLADLGDDRTHTANDLRARYEHWSARSAHTP